MSITWPPLNPDEVGAIARVHHGFLYQHVAAAQALVRQLLGHLDIVNLVVERDEDLELHFPTRSTYLQFKAREQLQFSQISDALLRLHQIRVEHEAGRRRGACRVGFFLGVSLGAELAGREAAHKNALLKKVRELAVSKGLNPVALNTTWNSLVWNTPGDIAADLGNITVRESAELALEDLVNDVGLVPGLAESAKTTALALVTSIHALAADSLHGFRERAVRPAQISLLIRTIEERAGRSHPCRKTSFR